MTDAEAVIVELFDNANARNWKAAMDAYADEVVLELHDDFSAIAGRGAAGKHAVGEWFGNWFATFDRDYRFEIHETRDLGDGRVFLDATHHGRGRASGAPITQRAAWIYSVRDGKVVRCDVYIDRDTALTAAGVPR